MRVAVTGATGFLGSNIVRACLQKGWEVSALARDEKKAGSLPAGVRAVSGDICDKTAIGRLMAGADIVFHTVSNFRVASGAKESYRHVNVEGTRTALDAAEVEGVKRFVHCSTIGVHGHVATTPGDEEAPFNPGDLYQETKLEAELLARDRAKSSKTEIVIVRPCSMYGPGDLRMLKMFRLLEKRLFFKIGPCSENFHAVYIDDVVAGFLRAAAVPGIAGEVFIVGGPEYVPLDRYIDMAAAAVGAPKPFLRFPYWFFYGAAWLCEKVFVPFRIEPPLHVRRVRFFKNNRAFSIAKARKVLDYEPNVGLAEGMRRTVDWYRQSGLLAGPRS